MLNKRKKAFFRKQEKFSIRKFKVGVASALIGLTFLFIGSSVSAEEVVELDKGAWPAAYVTKAVELGLLENANIENFGEATHYFENEF